MGSALGNVKVELPPLNNYLNNLRERKVTKKEKEVDIDVIEASNIALAIKHKEHTINVQLSLSCKNLPRPSTFKQVNSRIVVYKLNESSKQFIGKTEIIHNEVNPKFITSFVFSYNDEKHEEIEFLIYNIEGTGEDEDPGELIGKVSQKLDILVESELYQMQVPTADKKEKILLKANTLQYDGGNSKFQIELEATSFVGKLDLFVVVEVWKESQWMPVAKSKSIEIKKTTLFDKFSVPIVKFAGEENTRIRLKVWGVKEGMVEEEVGSTEELTILNVLTNDDKQQSQRVYKNGFVVGSITIHKWRKLNHDSFISYVVNGARLHLILGIDYTNSNNDGATSLHNLDASGSNLYIRAIQEIVGVLQFFDYYNQIALYGFGAKLPPYYKSVGQCFALNQNFFNPTVVGGVEEIIKYYLENLATVKPHGPTKLSEIIDIAIQFSQSEYQSTNYYVLILLTDGQINDFTDTLDKVIEASNLPLSIIIVCIGDKDFSLIQQLNKDHKSLRSQRHGTVCSRNIIDFINFKEFVCEEEFVITESNLARKTFSKIPAQFIDYMTRRNIKPNKEKKGLKTAKAQFISEKIKEHKKKYLQVPIVVVPQFLEARKRKMKKDLISLGFDLEDDGTDSLNIALDDLSYFIEINSFKKKPLPESEREGLMELIDVSEKKEFEQYLEKQDQLRNRRIQEELQKRTTNQFGIRQKQIPKVPELPKQLVRQLDHPCLNCKQEQISILHYDCGHLAVCQKCSSNVCFLCKHRCKVLININDQFEDHEDWD